MNKCIHFWGSAYCLPTIFIVFLATLAQKGMGLDAAGADEFAEVLARITADLEAMGMSDKAMRGPIARAF